MYKLFLLLFILIFMASGAIAGTLAGKVTAKETGEPLIGANVYLKGTTVGAATDEEGMYYIKVDDGAYDVVCDYVGYATITQTVQVSGETKVDFELTEFLFAKAIDVFADRAKERETPVAYTNVDKIEIENRLGSQDIPLVLNVTPSVFATDNGGGPGDSRINVRGFTQRNMAVMINGVPVNDMENGWVYWSNWDGLGDATSSIQVQRGLSAVNLATPSIGGTMNIITDPTAQKAGITYKNEIGIGNFRKQTLFANTGFIDNKFALTLGGVRKTGEGQVDAAWTDAWAYYLGAAYQINDKNRIELYATGAPQRHGQRRYRLNAANFSHELAKDLGYDDEILDDPRFADLGLLYNSNWTPVSTSYQGSQYWDGKQRERHDPTFINESENYYHKPIVNFNWYSQLSEKLNLFTTVYYSGGKGGGSGTYNRGFYYDYPRDRNGDGIQDVSSKYSWNYDYLQRTVDYDGLVAMNQDEIVYDMWVDYIGTDRVNAAYDSAYVKEAGESVGILRNSVNTQWTVGLLSKAIYSLSEELSLSFGLDWRTAEVEHYREVRDLLGGTFYRDVDENLNPINDFETYDTAIKKLGDRIDYNNTNEINWLGGYAQAEYTKDQLTVYGTAGYSVIKYFLTDHFVSDNGKQKEIESDYIGGYQLKGGVSYRLTDDLMLYANGGYVAKVPIFDQVIDDITTTLVEDFENEKFISGEIGANWKGLDNKLILNANLYYTNWDNRATTENVTNEDGTEGVIFLNGIAQTHMGVELDFAYQPINLFRLDGAASFGNWTYTKDVSGSYVSDISAGTRDDYDFFIKDLKVGDAPQTQVALAGSVFPIKGLQTQLIWRYYDRYYSDFDPFSRDDETDREQVWEVPSYYVFDLHFSYKIPTEVVDVKIFAHVFNLLDELYIQDATDNSSYNAYTANGTNHSADDAEVYPGLPRSFNLGIQVGL